MTIIEQMNDLQKDHKYILTKLYQAQRGEKTAESEDYWRGALKATESILDNLGVEHEKYNPLHCL